MTSDRASLKLIGRGPFGDLGTKKAPGGASVVFVKRWWWLLLHLEKRKAEADQNPSRNQCDDYCFAVYTTREHRKHQPD